MSRQITTQAILSWVEYSNILDQMGYARTTERVRSLPMLKALRIPTGPHDCSPVGFVHYRSYVSKWTTAGLKTRYNVHLQRREIYALVVVDLPVLRQRLAWERAKRVLIRATHNSAQNYKTRGSTVMWNQPPSVVPPSDGDALTSSYPQGELELVGILRRLGFAGVAKSDDPAGSIDSSLPEPYIDVNRYSVRDRITLKSRWSPLD
jgi:hypothetical protein